MWSEFSCSCGQGAVHQHERMGSCDAETSRTKWRWAISLGGRIRVWTGIEVDGQGRAYHWKGIRWGFQACKRGHWSLYFYIWSRSLYITYFLQNYYVRCKKLLLQINYRKKFGYRYEFLTPATPRLKRRIVEWGERSLFSLGILVWTSIPSASPPLPKTV